MLVPNFIISFVCENSTFMDRNIIYYIVFKHILDVVKIWICFENDFNIMNKFLTGTNITKVFSCRTLIHQNIRYLKCEMYKWNLIIFKLNIQKVCGYKSHLPKANTQSKHMRQIQFHFSSWLIVCIGYLIRSSSAFIQSGLSLWLLIHGSVISQLSHDHDLLILILTIFGCI